MPEFKKTVFAVRLIDFITFISSRSSVFAFSKFGRENLCLQSQRYFFTNAEKMNSGSFFLWSVRLKVTKNSWRDMFARSPRNQVKISSIKFSLVLYTFRFLYTFKLTESGLLLHLEQNLKNIILERCTLCVFESKRQ